MQYMPQPFAARLFGWGNGIHLCERNISAGNFLSLRALWQKNVETTTNIYPPGMLMYPYTYIYIYICMIIPFKELRRFFFPLPYGHASVYSTCDLETKALVCARHKNQDIPAPQLKGGERMAGWRDGGRGHVFPKEPFSTFWVRHENTPKLPHLDFCWRKLQTRIVQRGREVNNWKYHEIPLTVTTKMSHHKKLQPGIANHNSVLKFLFLWNSHISLSFILPSFQVPPPPPTAVFSLNATSIPQIFRSVASCAGHLHPFAGDGCINSVRRCHNVCVFVVDVVRRK